MRSVRFFFIASCFLSLLALDAKAQRLIPGQMSVYAEGSAWMAPGGGVGAGFIGRNFKWDASANYRTLDHHVALEESRDYGAVEYDLKAQDIYARLMYKRLVAHDRSYTWNLWIGVSFDPGVRLRNSLGEYEDFEDRVPSAVFIYGFTPELSLQFFPSRIFSMSVFARPRLSFNGSKVKLGERWFYPEFGMQFDFCFFTKR